MRINRRELMSAGIGAAASAVGLAGPTSGQNLRGGEAPTVAEPMRPTVFCWYEGTRFSSSGHMFPMVVNAGPDETVLSSTSGTTYRVANSYAAQIASLRLLPPGRRCLRVTWVNNWIFQNADDRCQTAEGNLGNVSRRPVATGGIYRGAPGRDGLPSGFSNAALDNFIAGARAWAEVAAAIIKTGGATVDFLAFDAEVKIDEFKVNAPYQAAIMTDPRWATLIKPRLDTIITEATGGAAVAFNAVSWLGRDPKHLNAWNAYMWERQAIALDAIIAGFQRVFPDCTGSNYQHHGRSGVVVNAGGIGRGVTDLNGHPHYQTRVTGAFSSDDAYGWMNQQEDQLFNTRSRSHWAGSRNPYHTLIWELSRSMAAVKSGRKVMPWIGWTGFDDSDFALGGYGEAGASDRCPYWEANLAAQALMASVPALVGDRWFNGLLQWNSRTYGASTMPTLSNGGIDQARKLFWDNGDRRARTRPGLMSSFIVINSGANNGTYTINYDNGGIWYDASTDRTYYAVNEAIPSPVSDGNISMNCTYAHDALTEAVLVDLDNHVGATGPREVLVRDICVGEAAADADSEVVPTGNCITWVGLRHGEQVTYCIAIGRAGADKSRWTEHAITGYLNGQSIGEVASVPSTRAYVYYTRTYKKDDVVTFRWTHGPVKNLLPSTDLTDSMNWIPEVPVAGSIASDAAKRSPIDASRSFKLFRSSAAVLFPVTPGNIFTVSCYVWVGDASDPYARQIEVRKGSNNSIIATNSNQYRVVDDNRWERYYLTFVAPQGEVACFFRIGLNNSSYRSWYCHPQAVQGILPGPIA